MFDFTFEVDDKSPDKSFLASRRDVLWEGKGFRVWGGDAVSHSGDDETPCSEAAAVTQQACNHSSKLPERRHSAA